MMFDNITNYYLLSVFSAWIISCIIKILINYNKHKKLNLSKGFENGGMPSSHAALIGSITFALLLHEGLSPIFFLSFVIATLILRDAVTVRQEVGLIGIEFNKMLEKNGEKKLKVIKGHTLKQVIIGLLIGIITTTIFYTQLLM